MVALFLGLIDSPEEQSEFISLYNKYKDGVYYIGMKYLHKHELAEDCTQEVFLTIAKNFKKIKEYDKGDGLKGLVFTIAKYTAMHIYNSENKHTTVSFTYNYKSNEQEFEEFSRTELKFAVNALPEELKTLVELKYVYGFTLDELSKLLSCSRSTVKYRVREALELLKEALEDKND